MSSREYRETNTSINYGTHMGSDTRWAFYPDRALRKAETLRGGQTWHYGTPDPLARRPFFACGEAATRGWAFMTWRNEFAREIWRKKVSAAYVARVVLPLP